MKTKYSLDLTQGGKYKETTENRAHYTMDSVET